MLAYGTLSHLKSTETLDKGLWSKVLCKFFNFSAPISAPKGGPPYDLFPELTRLQEILQQTANYYQQLPIKINGKPCLIQVDIEVTLSTLNPTPICQQISQSGKKKQIIPCTSPYNTQISLVRKPNGWGWRFV